MQKRFYIVLSILGAINLAWGMDQVIENVFIPSQHNQSHLPLSSNKSSVEFIEDLSKKQEHQASRYSPKITVGFSDILTPYNLYKADNEPQDRAKMNKHWLLSTGKVNMVVGVTDLNRMITDNTLEQQVNCQAHGQWNSKSYALFQHSQVLKQEVDIVQGVNVNGELCYNNNFKEVKSAVLYFIQKASATSGEIQSTINRVKEGLTKAILDHNISTMKWGRIEESTRKLLVIDMESVVGPKIEVSTILEPLVQGELIYSKVAEMNPIHILFSSKNEKALDFLASNWWSFQIRNLPNGSAEYKDEAGNFLRNTLSPFLKSDIEVPALREESAFTFLNFVNNAVFDDEKSESLKIKIDFVTKLHYLSFFKMLLRYLHSSFCKFFPSAASSYVKPKKRQKQLDRDRFLLWWKFKYLVGGDISEEFSKLASLDPFKDALQEGQLI